MDTGWPTSQTEGYSKSSLPLKSLLEINGAEDGRPSMIFVHRPQKDEKKAQKAHKKIFGSDDLTMGSKFFHCFRISLDDIENPAIRSQFSKKAPHFIFLDGDGNTVARYAGSVTHRSVLKGLGKTFAKSFSGRMSRQLRQFEDFLDEYEKVEDKIADKNRFLNPIKVKLDKKPTAKNQKKFDEVEGELNVLKAQLKKLEEKKSLILAPKASKKAIAKG